MLTKKERLEKLNNAGMNTGKYFSVNLPEGLAPGATIHLVIDENGAPVLASEKNNDVIIDQIITDGYVRNTKLHRRFVMAQMFQMLNYVSYDKKESGYHACLKNRYDYNYTFKMMLDEVKVLSKLEVKDTETFLERSSFFTKEVIVAVMRDYITKLNKHIDSLKVYRCKGVPYKRIKGMNVFVDDITKKIYFPLYGPIYRVEQANTYAAIYNALRSFVVAMVKLPCNTPKSKVWVDTFKGEGAYYTLKNLVMFHDCVIMDGYKNCEVFTQKASMHELNRKLDEYKGEGWRMFALMKKVIEDNNFDFKAKMEEIYNK